MKRTDTIRWMLLAAAGGLLTAPATPVHRYLFNGDVTDSVGGRDGFGLTIAGTYTEAPLFSSDVPAGAGAGAPLQSLEVGMTPGRVCGFELPADVISTQAGSVSFWFRADDLETAADYLFHHPTLSGGPTVKVRAGGGGIQFMTGGTVVAAEAAEGVWHHAAAVWDNGAGIAEYYLDGVAAAFTNFPPGAVVEQYSTRIGNFGFSQSNTNNQFRGRFYDLQIYDDMLTAAEVSDLHANPGQLPDPGPPPNIIFLLADDLGYGDLSCCNPAAEGAAPNNTPIRTPNIGSLATNGVRLTQFYSAAPICSPSRRALLTARYPGRLGEWAEGYASAPFGIEAAKEPTVAMWLKEAGYATACYGKWNVGNIVDVSWPGAHGFDDWLIIDHNTGYFQHQNDNADCHGQEMLFKTGGIRETSLRGKYLTDIFTDKALEFIDAHQETPFFLYLPFAVPHTPLQSPSGSTNTAYNAGPAAGSAEGRDVYVEMVEYLDSRIGKIFQCLENNGLLDNTLILFTSDNGGNLAANNWPLRSGKQYLEEGGVRVPCLMQWPGVLPAGRVSGQPSIMMDASVTLLAAADALQYVPGGRTLDGIDLRPLLQPAVADQPRTFGWRRRDWGQSDNFLRQEALLDGDWKYIRSYPYLGDGAWGTNVTEQIFHLPSDIGEATNLASANPFGLDELRSGFTSWKAESVDTNAEFLIWFADQTGSPGAAQLDAYLPTALNFSAARYVPNPSPNVPAFDLFDYTWDGVMQGSLLVAEENAPRVSDPVVSNGIFSVTIQPGTVHPTPILYREGFIDTSRFSVFKVRMRISGAAEPQLSARVLLRHDLWTGEDIEFSAAADGQWHEYAVDVSTSSAWAQWVRTGRIGLLLPWKSDNAVTVEVDRMRLESADGFSRLSLVPEAEGAMRLAFPSLLGRSYTLLFRENLSTGSWTAVSNAAPGSGEETEFSHADGSAISGFYKLMEE